MRKLKRNKRHHSMSWIKLSLYILLISGMFMYSDGFFKKLFKAIAKSVTGMVKHVANTIKAVAKGDIAAITQLTPMALQAQAASTILENVGGSLPPPMNQAASMAAGIAKAKGNMASGPMAAMGGLGGLPIPKGLPIPGMNGPIGQPGIGFPIPGSRQGMMVPPMINMPGNLPFTPPPPPQLTYPPPPPPFPYPIQTQSPQYIANSPFQRPQYPMQMPVY